MRIRKLDLEWHNIEHIAYHHVETYEVEEAMSDDVWFRKGPTRGRYYAYSRTGQDDTCSSS